MTYLLDITRLFRRALQPTPTGIDRVELAYARHLLARHAPTTTFIVRYRDHVWPLVGAAIPAFLAALDARWASADAPLARDARERLERFLAAPAGALDAPALAAAEPPSRNAVRAAMVRLFSPRSGWIGGLGRPFAEGAIYLNVSHEGLTEPGDMERLTRRRGWRAVYLIHDLIPLTHPEYVRPGDAEKHAVRMRAVLGTAAAAIYNSRHTARAMAEFAAAEGQPAPRGLVNLLGVEDAFQPLPAGALATAAPYFVMVGTIEPRKNHLLLLHLWRQLAQELGPATPRLVLVGRRGWENENVLDLLDRCPALTGHVLECNHLSDQQLKRLLAGARAMLLPSFAEGFGLPLAEAMAMGVPVIAADLEVFHEIAGDLPRTLDPTDGPGWRQVILDYARPDSAARAAQIARLEGFRSPTWDSHFAATDALLHALSGDDLPREEVTRGTA